MTNWLYEQAGNFTLPDPDLAIKVQTDALRNTASAFIVNVRRVRQLWALNPHLHEQASSFILMSCEATLAVTGNRIALTEEEKSDPAFMAKINKKFMEAVVERFEQTGSVDAAVRYDFDRAVKFFDKMLDHLPQIKDAIHATLSSQITSAWTAFETLAADLWESAINFHPTTLAKLLGKRRRIAKSIGVRERDADDREEQADSDEFEPKLSAVEQITKGTYDASKVMGTLLRKQFGFQRLSGIRKAYSAAFSKDYDEIDSALSGRGLDKLNLFRNLLLHKAGVVDQPFLDGVKLIPDWKVDAEFDQPIPLNGEVVRNLISPVFECGEKLIYAVDKWLS